MNNLNILYKLNGLLFLIIAAMLVFVPQQIATFLSDSRPAPVVVIISIGVVLNLLGLLLLWLGNQQKPNPQWSKVIATIDFTWVIVTAGLMLSQNWITQINGMTVAGLAAIFIGWVGWQLWLQHSTRH